MYKIGDDGMANGRTEIEAKELHEKGCEYGRSLSKDVGYMQEDLSEIKADIKELKESTQRIEKSLAQTEWMKAAGTAGISAIVSMVVSAFMPWKGKG